MIEPDADLPRPDRSRWQPLRLGLVDLFYYDDEQFWFHDGRLLLRGNNGTGKSKVLALTLPFVLDGSTAARRVEPDADPKKRMDWNLLLDGALHQNERTGYSWVEFGRIGPSGVPEYCTLGIGLKAAAGRGIVKTWYFVTDRRIGDLRLVDDNRVVLTAERLRTDLSDSGAGQVYTTQESYRRAVDEALFRLGEERYAALIDLLIQLRQPQLSKRPDEKLLSAALTEALAPLDQAVITDAAESFRSLEEERSAIADAKAVLASAEAFLQHYRVYARTATRRHTTAVRVANSAFEHTGRELIAAQDDLTRVREDIDTIVAEQDEAKHQQAALDGQEQVLRGSPEMRDAHRLDEAAKLAAETDGRVEVAQRAEAAAAERAHSDTHAHEVREQELTAADADAHRTRLRAAELAGSAGLAADHEAIVTDEAAAERVLARRREQIRHVEHLLEVATQARTRAQQLRTVLDDAETERSRRVDAERDAQEQVAEKVAEYRDAVRHYVSGLSELTVRAGADDLAAMAEQWALDPVGPSSVVRELDETTENLRAAIERDRAGTRHELGQRETELGVVEAELARLRAGHEPGPPPAPGRDKWVRGSAAGAPLWRLVDFTGLDDGERSGLEAALQSAGLLDAWVFADGTVDAAGDVVLGPTGVVATHSVVGVLTPAIGPDDADRGLTDAVVMAVLDRIGLGEGSADLWIGTDGSWGAGPARGTWAKDRAEFIGAGAREQRRLTLIGEFEARHDELSTLIGRYRDALVEADRRLAAIHAEHAAYPADAERLVFAAHQDASAAGRELSRARERVDDARARWETADADADAAHADLVVQAGELHLGTTAPELKTAEDALGEYRLELVQLRGAETVRRTAATAVAEALARASDSAAVLGVRRAESSELRELAARRRATWEALQATVGASVADVQNRLAEVDRERKRLTRLLSALGERRLASEREDGRLEQLVRDVTVRREERDADRLRVVGDLRGFTGTGLVRVAVPELEVPDPRIAEAWTVTAALGLSRAAEQQLSRTDESDEAWSRLQQRLSNAATELSTHMSRYGHVSFMEQRGEVQVARVRFFGDEIGIDSVAERLTGDVADRERLLSAREREILENHLVNEVAGHVHELLMAAEGQIDRMNRELAERKTSTGMQLRVVWRERGDGPAGLAAARELLGRSDATWTPDDRTAIGEFLQARITEVREADPTGSWQDHLERALDYRQWHAFVVQLRQNGQWRSASGPASGGEKVLAVSIPLFAAASAHYNSADPTAPRLILLDEAFAGVDDDSRAKSLGLLATFDLDVVMTSEREWGCYPQVPGLSIAQLSRVDGVDAIGVSRWRWDGRRRERLPELPGPNDNSKAETAPADDDQYGLPL